MGGAAAVALQRAAPGFDAGTRAAVRPGDERLDWLARVEREFPDWNVNFKQFNRNSGLNFSSTQWFSELFFSQKKKKNPKAQTLHSPPPPGIRRCAGDDAADAELHRLPLRAIPDRIRETQRIRRRFVAENSV